MAVRVLEHSDFELGPGASLERADLRGASLAGVDLSGADLTRADLSGADLTGAKLIGAVLHEANLESASLVGADCSGADLSRCSATQASFGGANLVGACLRSAGLHATSFARADLRRADLDGAQMTETRLVDARLEHADFSRADLTCADLARVHVRGASFRFCALTGSRLADIDGYERADWIGADLREADFRGAMLLRRHVQDESYLWEWRHASRRNRLLYPLWKATSDCGRSFGRWGGCIAVLAVVFSVVYALLPIDYGPHATALSPVYFSIVTLTTLGFGDALPTTAGGQLAVMAEVSLAYVMLGGLIGIFANKMARRAG